MSTDYEVIVNGGGPVGMGLAIELGLRGVRTCVVERYPEPQRVPKGQNLTQRTAEHFYFWNIEPELRAAQEKHAPLGSGIGGMTAYGTLLSDYRYDWLNRARVGKYYYVGNARLPQYATEKVLRSRVAQIDCVDVRYGWSGTALSQDESGVTLDIIARDGEGGTSLTADYLVGADGSHSFVREAAGITQTRSDHDRLMALLVFTSEELHDLLKRYPGKSFYNVLHPDYQGYWLFFGRVDHGKSWFFHAPVPPGTTEEGFDFEALLHRAVGRTFELSLDYVGFWNLRIAIAERYSKGRVFIAGDAAHSHPPYGGYGINTGLEDAKNLGWKLAATLRVWGGPALLGSYDGERRPVFASTARDFIERFIRDDRTFLSTYAPEKDKAAFEEAWHSRNLDADEVNAFEPNYEGSTIVTGPEGAPSARGSHSFKARPGHHLPPVALADGRMVQEALGAEFTLLALNAAADEVSSFKAAASEAGIPLKIVEGGAEAGTTYGAPLVLVRPDQFVAWAGRGGAAADILGRAAGYGGEDHMKNAG